ncbi:hypothetical protein [Rhizobium oryzicola]|uniref:Uncharacterized protein n=1 Tax=Rhizobium oryzicola TaxID=1232668 RepID=A0ABT8SVN5_9HYPH|nr:hypothetical protein [Rhizobium oryzicola]MDO1582509.1 hypothetical protein [Rhizobium oryzicola]
MPTQNSIDWQAELSHAKANDLTIRELSEKLGVQSPTVRKYEFRTGIRLRRVNPDAAKTGKPSLNWEEILTQAKEEGLNAHRLAIRLNMSRAAVLSAEDRTGIHLPRSRPGRHPVSKK